MRKLIVAVMAAALALGIGVGFAVNQFQYDAPGPVSMGLATCVTQGGPGNCATVPGDYSWHYVTKADGSEMALTLTGKSFIVSEGCQLRSSTGVGGGSRWIVAVAVDSLTWAPGGQGVHGETQAIITPITVGYPQTNHGYSMIELPSFTSQTHTFRLVLTGMMGDSTIPEECNMTVSAYQ